MNMNLYFDDEDEIALEIFHSTILDKYPGVCEIPEDDLSRVIVGVFAANGYASFLYNANKNGFFHVKFVDNKFNGFQSTEATPEQCLKVAASKAGILSNCEKYLLEHDTVAAQSPSKQRRI